MSPNLPWSYSSYRVKTPLGSRALVPPKSSSEVHARTVRYTILPTNQPTICSIHTRARSQNSTNRSTFRPSPSARKGALFPGRGPSTHCRLLREAKTPTSIRTHPHPSFCSIPYLGSSAPSSTCLKEQSRRAASRLKTGSVDVISFIHTASLQFPILPFMPRSPMDASAVVRGTAQTADMASLSVHNLPTYAQNIV